MDQPGDLELLAERICLNLWGMGYRDYAMWHADGIGLAYVGVKHGPIAVLGVGGWADVRATKSALCGKWSDRDPIGDIIRHITDEEGVGTGGELWGPTTTAYWD